jgi:predicted small secreted protein
MRLLLRALAVAVMLGAALSMMACNTFHGMGEDIKVTGEAIEDAAD